MYNLIHLSSRIQKKEIILAEQTLSKKILEVRSP